MLLTMNEKVLFVFPFLSSNEDRGERERGREERDVRLAYIVVLIFIIYNNDGGAIEGTKH